MKKNPIKPKSFKTIETHCHLDYLKSAPLDDILKTCQEENIEKIITVAVSKENQDAVIELAQKYHNVYTTQGIHPHNAKEWDESLKIKILENLKSNKICAYGEIGLDYHYNLSPQKIQQRVFEEQLEIAISHKLPIIIHSREAEDDTMAILSNHKNYLPSNVVIHSFTSKLELAKFALNNDMFLGFNGILTFKSAANVQEAFLYAPLEKIVVETDAPFLAPDPYRGRENSPALIPWITQKMSLMKEVLQEDLCYKLYENSSKLFRL